MRLKIKDLEQKKWEIRMLNKFHISKNYVWFIKYFRTSYLRFLEGLRTCKKTLKRDVLFNWVIQYCNYFFSYQAKAWYLEMPF